MRKLIGFFIFLLSLNVYSQSPDWSVNVNNFQYSMTFTAFLNVNGVTLSNSNDKVGAFVNNENRGEATVVYNANAQKYVAYLTVYGNVGETIHFKIYDSQNDQIVSTTQTQLFLINGNVGGVFQSFSIANPALAKTAIIASFSLKDIVHQSSISDNKISIIVNENADLTNLIPIFTTVNNGKVFLNNQKVTSGLSSINFLNSVTLDVLSEDESILNSYEISIQKSNNIPKITAALTSDTQIINTHPLSVNLSYSDVVDSTVASFFECNNCVVSKLSTTNNIDFIVEIIPLSEGTFSIKLKENMVIGSNNQTNNVSNILEIISDTKKPYIKSIQRASSTDESTADSILMFDITFNEPVKNISEEDFYSIENSILSLQKNTESNYTITISNIENHEGIVSVYLKQSTDITDIAGNVLQISKMGSYEKK